MGRLYTSIFNKRTGLFNYDEVYATTRPVYIVKGEIPAALLCQLGYLACAPTGGEGMLTERFRTALAVAPKILIGDNDVPGHILGDKRAKVLDAQVFYPPDPYKDIDQWLLAEPSQAKNALDHWREVTQQIWW